MKLFAISESHLTDRITKNLELTSSVFIYMPAMSIPFPGNENSEATRFADSTLPCLRYVRGKAINWSAAPTMTTITSCYPW